MLDFEVEILNYKDMENHGAIDDIILSTLLIDPSYGLLHYEEEVFIYNYFFRNGNRIEFL